MQRRFRFSPVIMAAALAWMAAPLAWAQQQDLPPPAEPEKIAPPDEIQLPPPPAEEEIDRPRRASPPARIRAPFADIDVDPDGRPRVDVRTPWADVHVESRNGSRVYVDTPWGRIPIDTGRRETVRREPLGEWREGTQRPMLGVKIRDDDGIRITSVLEDSPADEANLAAGDEIISLNGIRYGEARSLLRALSRMAPGESVRLFIRRNGTIYRADATLDAYDENDGR